MSEVRLTPSGQRTLESLNSETRERVKDALREAVEHPERELERLREYAYYKLRVGDYRALIDWEKEGDEDVLWVFAVGHRRNVYDRYLPP
ncbi:MAG: type II toxin-antitoxin system RelE family toxin [Halobacteriales archaeon]